MLNLISGIIAGGLYGNIGLKILYVNVIEDMFHGPSLLTLRGRVTWSISVVLFWAGGFVIAAAIPQVQTLSGMGTFMLLRSAFGTLTGDSWGCHEHAVHLLLSDRFHILVSVPATRYDA